VGLLRQLVVIAVIGSLDFSTPRYVGTATVTPSLVVIAIIGILYFVMPRYARRVPRLGGLTPEEQQLAAEVCEFFSVPLGTLIRRAEAVRLAGGHDNFGDCNREAVRHLIGR